MAVLDVDPVLEREGRTNLPRAIAAHVDSL